MAWRRRLAMGVVVMMVGTLALAGDAPAEDSKAAGARDAPAAIPDVVAAGADSSGGMGLEPEPSLGALLWDASLSLRAWGGYNDNPLLSSVNPAGSALAGFGGEFLLLRIPADGREAALFALVEQVEYVEKAFNPETVAVINARFRRRWDDGWSVGGAAEYFYMRQVFDASDIVGLPVIVPARGHTVTVRPLFGREWGRGWRVELELEASRQWLEAPLDSFWDAGPKLGLVRALGARSEVAATYRYRRRMFDDRFPLDPEGLSLPGELVFNQHEFEVPWRQAWGVSERWRTTLRAGLLESQDNGGGFFDYHRVQLAGGVRYVRKSWEARAEVKSRWYLYPVQKAGNGDDTLRRREDLALSARVEWMVVKGLRVFGEYEFEASDENVRASDYQVNSATAGMELVW